MGTMEVVLIDVGSGDSILIKATTDNSESIYALVDSNDSMTLRSSYIFLKRYFEKEGITSVGRAEHLFEFVLLSHAHADHTAGLKGILRSFGCKNLWYPKSLAWAGAVDLIRFANNSDRVVHHQSIDNTKVLPSFGNINIRVIWPLYKHIDPRSENNNSVVMILTLKSVSFVLTGDAEAKVWTQISHQIPRNTQFFKVPHHGSVNGTFGRGNTTPWFIRCPKSAKLGISTHVVPHNHPDPQVINLFSRGNRNVFRTDEHYHITFKTDGNNTEVKYSHF